MKEEHNLVENWLRVDPRRWIAGVFAGVLAIWIAFGVGGLIASANQTPATFPIKLIGTIALGPIATDYSMNEGLVAGATIITILAAFLGFIYSHFVYSNSWGALLPMGLVWGIFSWIFIWNLFFQSFRPIFAASVSSGAAIAVCLSFGICLASVRFFYNLLRSR